MMDDGVDYGAKYHPLSNPFQLLNRSGVLVGLRQPAQAQLVRIPTSADAVGYGCTNRGIPAASSPGSLYPTGRFA